jgi:hypothetical protein
MGKALRQNLQIVVSFSALGFVFFAFFANAYSFFDKLRKIDTACSPEVYKYRF